jgi:predicted AAA+ superfamily ATPase
LSARGRGPPPPRRRRALQKGWRFSSYRSEGGAEVDLVIETARELIGIEVKAGRTVSPSDARGLLSLAELVGPRQRLRKWILFRGDRRQRFANGVEAWPVLEALRGLA